MKVFLNKISSPHSFANYDFGQCIPCIALYKSEIKSKKVFVILQMSDLNLLQNPGSTHKCDVIRSVLGITGFELNGDQNDR